MRKIAYAVSGIILTACGGGGGDSPSVSNTPAQTQNVVEQPYFSEVANGFPDPTNMYWFFDSTKPNNTHPGKVNAVASIDLNNDGIKEFLMVIYKGQGHDLLRGQFVSDPCKTTTVIWEHVNGKFVDASDKYLEQDRDFQSCIGDEVSSIVDINNDGKPDIFFSGNQEDGRNPNLGSSMGSPLVGWISQPNGKYKIAKFGPSIWYHSIGHGIDDSGNKFVTGAGFYPAGTINAPVQNQRYIWNGRELQAIYDTYFPVISPVTFLFLSRNGTASDLLIQHYEDQNTQLGAVGYYKENSIWYKTNTISVESKFLAEETFQLWSGDSRKIKVLSVDGHAIAGWGGGSNLTNLCELKLYKDQKSIAAGVMNLAKIPNYTPGKTINSNEIVPHGMIVAYDIKDKKLSVTKLTITGEDNYSPGKMQCTDVNGDGYDDIVLGLGNDDNLRHQRIYINQKDGTFKKFNLGTQGVMALNNNVDVYFSHMDDFNNDGMKDIIVFPGNHTSNSSLAGTLKFYKGTKAIQ